MTDDAESDASDLLIDASKGTFDSVAEAIELASSYDPQRYVARGPRGRFSVFLVGEIPWGHDENWSLRSWPLEQITVFLPPSYAEQPGSGSKVENYEEPPDFEARADEDTAFAALEGGLEEDPGDDEKNDA
jgi:hypothetical protein